MRAGAALGGSLAAAALCAVAATACEREGASGASGGSAAPGQTGPVGRRGGLTWYQNVLPIVERRCQGCHVAGGLAPFPLTTPREGQQHHELMAVAARAGLMPPWMPAADCQSFRDSRRMRPEEVQVLADWSREGAPAGTVVDGPGAPPATALPWVDLQLDAGVDYTPRPPPGRFDDYRCFAIDPALATDGALVGFDIQPGVRGEVHHVVLFEATREAAEARDRAEEGPGWTCFGGPGTGESRLIASWVPGSSVTQHPGDTAVRLTAGAVIVMQVHYNNQFTPPAPDRTRLALQLARGPTRPAELVPLVDPTFQLPPRSFDQTATAMLPLGQRRALWGVQPHMHTLGKTIQLDLVDPVGRATCLLRIPRWQFHWQQLYFYDGPAGIPLPAGSRVKVTCTWDNPHDQPVRWGEGTSDEMCAAVLYVTAE